MLRTFYSTVSDIAVCQRCPALFGYKIHMKIKDAWLEGIKGKGYFYGSMFHRHIAQVFFEAASDSCNCLHAKLVRAISEGEGELEEFIRENIFMPFIEKFSERYTAGQLMAAASGVKVWVKAMWDFFSEIPSLMKNPAQNMSTIFLQPEQKLQAYYDFPNEGRLVITGCYDALMFNPDKAEARLFEFKGYSKSDAAVPLSQSLMYAWLIEKFSGIIPSVEIIYLDEDERQPDIFDPASVRSMIISGLPGLFYAAFNTITLRRLPKIMKDKDSCGRCRFRNQCDADWDAKFRRRTGASLINVMVFMLAAVIIMTQTFFFANLSHETSAVQAENINRRFKFDYALSTAINIISSDSFAFNATSPEITYANSKDFNAGFNKTRLHSYSSDISGDIAMDIFDMFYNLKSFDVDSVRLYRDSLTWRTEPNKIFPAIIPEAGDNNRFFMVRIYDTGSNKSNKLMYQAVIRRNPSVLGAQRAKVLSFKEVWY